MKTNQIRFVSMLSILLTPLLLLDATGNVSAATLYVSLESPNPVPPYATWGTAATNIQHAVDAAKAGDTVLVTNGVYAAGSRESSVLDTNQQPPQVVSIGLSRVAVTNAIRLESVNGPLVTTINGGGSVRCVYLGTNALLSGFTLTNGSVGVYSEAPGVVTNCTLTGNRLESGAVGGTLYNCTLTGNYGGWGGGGARASTLYSCTLAGNWARGGGGASDSTLYNCTVTGNSAFSWGGGGVENCTLFNCTLSGNSACGGGGASYSTLYNCTLTGNTAGEGGGAYGSTLYNCTLTENSAGCIGGGAYESTLYNCTVTGNSASWWGGGASTSILYNSIVYYNSGDNYAEGTILNYCCTIPLPTNGVGNITGPPLFMDFGAGDYRLWEGSPCIDAGTNLSGFPMTKWKYVSELSDYDWVIVGYITDPTDIVGNTRFIDGNGDGNVAWDIGAYEFNSFKPPRFTCPPQLMPEGCRLSIAGAPNKWVCLQRSRDLKNWETVWLLGYGGVFFMGPEGFIQVDDRQSDDEGRKVMFYRVVVE